MQEVLQKRLEFDLNHQSGDLLEVKQQFKILLDQHFDHLKFRCSKSCRTSTELKEIMEILSVKLPSLVYAALFIEKSNFNNETLAPLLGSLSNCKKLKTLELHIFQAKVDDQGIAQLMGVLPSLDSLRDFRLDGHSHITNIVTLRKCLQSLYLKGIEEDNWETHYIKPV